jgi:hypothetical protein
MKCQKDQCRSPLACSGFGYCRERNFQYQSEGRFHDYVRPDPETIKQWQAQDKEGSR